MPVITFSVQHGRTLEEARQRLATAVDEVHRWCGALVQHVTWSADDTQVRLEGVGYWVEMRVDAQAVHVAGDVAGLGGLLGGPLVRRITQLVQQTLPAPAPLRRHRREARCNDRVWRRARGAGQRPCQVFWQK